MHVSAMQKDFAWFLCRLPTISNPLDLHRDEIQQRIPAWTSFNVSIQTAIPRQSVIGYCQVIDANPTELTTVYTILQQSIAMADAIGQHDVPVVFDQASFGDTMAVQQGV